MKLFAHVLMAAFVLSGTAWAVDIQLPKQVRVTKLPPRAAYKDQDIIHNQFVAIGQALKDAAGAELVEIPAATDTDRTAILLQGKADFSSTAVGGSVVAQEGVFGFAGKDWGPQKIRLVLANIDEPIDYGIAVAGDLGIKTYADLKGKRVAWYSNVPVVNVNTEAFLAYGGLSWDDVEKVEISGFFGEALKALGDGKVDAVFADTLEKMAYVDAEGPRGLYWPEIDPDDDEAFERLFAIAPYFIRHHVDEGAGVDPAKGLHGAHYPYPILVAVESADTDLVFNMTKALVEFFPQYQGKAFGIDGWKFSEKELRWFVPYHEGAIAYFKEMGVWTDAIQAHNDQLIARQEALALAWAALQAENPDDWESAWAERRRQALKDGSFQMVF